MIKRTTRDNNGSGNRNGNTITALKCQNKGSASGFDTALDQECENTICTHPSAGATCVEEEGAAAAAQAPIKLTCEQCFTKFLKPEQITAVVGSFPQLTSLAELCESLPNGGPSVTQLGFALDSAGVDASVKIKLLECLRQAGTI